MYNKPINYSVKIFAVLITQRNAALLFLRRRLELNVPFLRPQMVRVRGSEHALRLVFEN